MCWFSADGPLAEEFVHTLGLRPGVYEFGPAPVERINEMTRALQADPSLDGRRAASLLAIRMLYDVAARVPPPAVASLVRQVRHLIREGLADPDLSAARIAQQLNYHRGSLSRAFHAQTGMTILDCITQTRLHEAELLLQQSDERITDVAHKCGFPDGAYFTRWVKRHTGRLPSQIRRSAAVGGV
jgi:AraC-like DNA-binding protein